MKKHRDTVRDGEAAPGAYPIHDQRPVAYRGIPGRRQSNNLPVPTNAHGVSRIRTQNNVDSNSNNIPPELRCVVTSEESSSQSLNNANHIPPELRVVSTSPVREASTADCRRSTQSAPQHPTRPSRAALPRQNSEGLPCAQTAVPSISARVMELLHSNEESNNQRFSMSPPLRLRSADVIIVLEDEGGPANTLSRSSSPLTADRGNAENSNNDITPSGSKLKISPSHQTGSNLSLIKKFLIVAGGLIVIGVAVAVAVMVSKSAGKDSISSITNSTSTIANSTKLPGASASSFAPTIAVTPAVSSPSPSSATLSVESIRDLLLPISGELLLDESTPQYEALTWLAESDKFFLGFWDDGPVPDHIHTRVVERYIMVVLYFSTNGPVAWTGDHRFLNPRESICAWADDDGSDNDIRSLDIHCDAPGGFIDWLSIVNFGLWGTIPAEIGFLTLLTVLNMMDHSRMWGEIPDLRRLSVLADLNLFGNNLGGTIPSTIGMHTSMTHLDLSYNWLVSTVPSSLGSLLLLEELYLEDNELVGSLPFAMIKLRGLSHGWFHGNHLDGDMSMFCDFPDETLVSLSADCDKVECNCCTCCNTCELQ